MIHICHHIFALVFYICILYTTTAIMPRAQSQMAQIWNTFVYNCTIVYNSLVYNSLVIQVLYTILLYTIHTTKYLKAGWLACWEMGQNVVTCGGFSFIFNKIYKTSTKNPNTRNKNVRNCQKSSKLTGRKSGFFSGRIQRVQNLLPFSTKPTSLLSGDEGAGNHGLDDVEVEQRHYW